MKNLLNALLITLTLTAGSAYAADMDMGEKPSPLTAEQAIQRLHDGKAVYSCGMKPTWFSDKPGQCPCCTMELEKVKTINEGKALFDSASQDSPMMEMKK